MGTFTIDRLRAARLSAQGLASPSAGDPVAVARRLVVVQSQDRFAASLALRARARGFTDADVERRRVEERSLLRTWLHRGTIQLLAAEDCGWLLALLGPVAARASASRWRALGLDDDTWARARRVLRRELAHGPLTRAAVGERLRAGGVDPEGQRLPHLLMRAALEGLVCDGPDDAGQRTWVPLSDWVSPPAGPRGEAAIAELARRYLRGHGPATPADFAWWSGLPAGRARAAFRALGDELAECRGPDGPLASLAESADAPDEPLDAVRLLPAFDAYLLGYRPPRPHALDAHAAKAVLAGGMVKPFVCRGGVAVGIWRPRKTRGRLDVLVRPFPGAAVGDLDAEVGDLARYTGLEARLEPAPD